MTKTVIIGFNFYNIECRFDILEMALSHVLYLTSIDEVEENIVYLVEDDPKSEERYEVLLSYFNYTVERLVIMNLSSELKKCLVKYFLEDIIPLGRNATLLCFVK